MSEKSAQPFFSMTTFPDFFLFEPPSVPSSFFLHDLRARRLHFPFFYDRKLPSRRTARPFPPFFLILCPPFPTTFLLGRGGFSFSLVCRPFTRVSRSSGTWSLPSFSNFTPVIGNRTPPPRPPLYEQLPSFFFSQPFLRKNFIR